MTTQHALRTGLLAASSALALVLPGVALAQEQGAPAISIDRPSASVTSDAVSLAPSRDAQIITRDDILPNVPAPAGALDSGVTGVGQMVIRNSPTSFSVGLCTGSLINPRTVLFAAHCANNRPADAYGSPTGGVPMSFGFNADNLPAVRQWLGLDGGTVNATNKALNLYNVEHLWYDQRSLAFGFLEADIALATLDTPAFDIPTWAMLFTPIDQQEHVTIIGYGGRGTNASGNLGIDWRRRIAENYVSFLGSLDDLDTGLGFSAGGLPQNLYFTAFTDPSGIYDVTQLRLDFGIFGSGDTPLPREGTTAGGDSGGPLVLDQKYNRDVIIGVLSGGGSIFGTQFGDAYGSYSFYQPLHAFWQVIVANNPYVYATTKGGKGQWTDPNHWVQAMDPNYLVGLDGNLLNRLPNAPGAEVGGEGAKFGEVCGIQLTFPFPKTGQCTQFEQDAVVGATGPQFFVEGGPGTQNFVPNNIRANPQAGIRPRYFDVTLNRGSTTLSGADITIDRFTMEGLAKLEVAQGASLSVLGDYTQLLGWTDLNGRISANETFLLSGVLSGTGTFRTPFLTSVASIIAPGAARGTGTLTIDGNAILASGSTLMIELNRAGSDRLSVTGTLSLSDPGDANAIGSKLVINKAAGAAPRWGQTFTIAQAGTGIDGQFGKTYAALGVLRPELTYTGNEVTATLQAGRLSDLISPNALTATAFAVALDLLRDRSYTSLYNLYGAVDLMDGAALTQSLSSLAPRSNEQGRQLFERQSRQLFGVVTDRLSTIGSAQATTGTLSIIGSPLGVIDQDGTTRAAQLTRAGFAGLAPDQQRALALPEGVTGFVTGGIVAGQSLGYSADRVEDGTRSTYFGMGLEHEVARNFMLGIAAGHASGSSFGGGDQARSTLDQVALYGSYQLGGGAYTGFAANMEQARIRTARFGIGLAGGSSLFGEQDASRIALVSETGVNVDIARGLTLTPRVQLGYTRAQLSSMTELGGEAALAIDDVTTQRVDAKVGMKLAGSHSLGNGWTFVPQLQADYVRLLDGAESGMEVRFAGADYVAIALPLAGGDNQWGELKGGFTVGNRTLQLGAGFETSVGRSDLRDDRAMADLTIRF
ncbi:autotransporter outer membrane beta-barrel domain-containing protein [Porphyrobacter sp. GA68]|uniref:autotransporter outer membrane beta-barrel domain-containing protein n=1 Tax=Porphyrobacter sp. GA68 TaxID=2883480 RepID=UPI001D17DE60|nr:autotransporter outer membrane beta-barrel domain-containing protein [Porphyrobacter sp. GA68]